VYDMKGKNIIAHLLTVNTQDSTLPVTLDNMLRQQNNILQVMMPSESVFGRIYFMQV
jgi:hypothetical protein